MAEVRFYHLARRSMEQTLPELLTKALAGGYKVVVRCRDQGECARLDHLLWTYDDHSFLPHGLGKNDHAHLQPVVLTAHNENPNGAKVLMLTAPIDAADVAGYDLTCLIFDGRREDQEAEARAFWTHLKGQGVTLTYWQQNDQGGWEQKSKS